MIIPVCKNEIHKNQQIITLIQKYFGV
jgi:hypothetical protein